MQVEISPAAKERLESLVRSGIYESFDAAVHDRTTYLREGS